MKKKTSLKEPENPKSEPTPSAPTADNDTQKNNTTKETAPTATTPTPSSLSPEEQAKADLAKFAELLGIPQLAQQLTVVTERLNALTKQATHPQPQPGAAGLMGLLSNPFVAGLLEKVATAIAGGGQQTPGVDQDLMKEIMGNYKAQQQLEMEATRTLRDKIRAGGQVMVNNETGEVKITGGKTGTGAAT